MAVDDVFPVLVEEFRDEAESRPESVPLHYKIFKNIFSLNCNFFNSILVTWHVITVIHVLVHVLTPLVVLGIEKSD